MGLSAATILIDHGRIAGISGIFTGLPSSSGEEFSFRASFLAGISAGGFAAASLALGTMASFNDDEWIRYAIGGAIVGVGVTLGHGCTSGHGLCGLGRMSKRSMFNVAAFLTSGVVTASLLSPTSIALDNFHIKPMQLPLNMSAFAQRAAVALIAPGAALVGAKQLNLPHVASFVSGSLFGLGLVVSGMALPIKHAGFLNVFSPSGWDPSLACVLGAGVTVSYLSYKFIEGRKKPTMKQEFQIPTNTTIDARLILGGAIFGIGWAISQQCPGPVFANLLQRDPLMPLVWLGSLLAGSVVTKKLM